MTFLARSVSATLLHDDPLIYEYCKNIYRICLTICCRYDDVRESYITVPNPKCLISMNKDLTERIRS